MTLAATNCRSKNIGVLAVIVSELKLSDIERHVLAADLVERPDDTALEYRPEALNRVRVDLRRQRIPSRRGPRRGACIRTAPDRHRRGSYRSSKLTLYENYFANEASARFFVTRSRTRVTTLPLRLIAPMIGVLPRIPPIVPLLPPCLLMALLPM
jgi:hypothetical protein